MAQRLSPINDPFKLVDACNRCVTPPGRAQSGQDPTLSDFQMRLQLTMEYLERELKRKGLLGARKDPDENERIQTSGETPKPFRLGKSMRMTITTEPRTGKGASPARESLEQYLNGLEGLSKMGSA